MEQRNAMSQLPIGYWLKHTDELITQRSNQVLSNHGFTRSRWQVLNIFFEADGPLSKARVFDIMQTFIDARQLETILEGLLHERWLVSIEPDQYLPGASGKEMHATILEQQMLVRKRAIQNITEQEYKTAIDVLQQIVKNLE